MRKSQVTGQMNLLDYLNSLPEETEAHEESGIKEDKIPEIVVHTALNIQITQGDQDKIRKIIEDNPKDSDCAPLIKKVYGCSGCGGLKENGLYGIDTFTNNGITIEWMSGIDKHKDTFSWVLVSELIRSMIKQGIYGQKMTMAKRHHAPSADNPLLKLELGKGFDKEMFENFRGDELTFRDLKDYVGEKIIIEKNYNHGNVYVVVKLTSFNEDSEKVYRNSNGEYVGEYLYEIAGEEKRKSLTFAGMASRIGYASGIRETKENSWVSELFCANGKYSKNVYQAAPPYNYYAIK